MLEGYDLDRLTVATLASHSSLQIVHGAKKEGFETLLVVTEDRAYFYRQFDHLVDHFILVGKWRDICSERVMRSLREHNAILIPHGSFVEYVGIDCALSLQIPFFGLRSLLSVEANQRMKMELLRRSRIPVPKDFLPGDNIDRLVIVKLPGAKGGRGYFVTNSQREVVERLETAIRGGELNDIDEAIVQEYLIGVTAYIHYFYSPILNRLEITGADIRYESDVDGLRRIPLKALVELGLEPTFTVVGNIPLVLRESLLPVVYEYGVRFVNTTKELLPPGIIGPFCLEGVIDRNTGIKIFEFSGRIVAGTNLYLDGSPYSYLYWDEPMSVGRRIAREMRLALERGALDKVIT